MIVSKKNIRKIRQLLPHVYSDELAERLEGYTSADVKKAFSGQIKDEKKVAEIMAEALKWAEERREEEERTTQKINELLKGSK